MAIGISTIVIITVITVVILTTLTLGLYSFLRFKQTHPHHPTAHDEEYQMTLLPNVAAPSTSTLPPFDPTRIPEPSEPLIPNRDRNNLHPPTRQFSFDKNSVDGLEEIDLAVPEPVSRISTRSERYYIGKEAEDPLVEKVGRKVKGGRWV